MTEFPTDEQSAPASGHGGTRAGATQGVVVIHADGKAGFLHRHEKATRTDLGKRIARLKGFDFAGDYDPSTRYRGDVYFLPSTTITSIEARRLGIHDEHDLFGGVVPSPFVATKAITHPLIAPDATAPEGWSHEFDRHVHDSVPSGFTAFTLDDARRAGARLLSRGDIRVKPVLATGGHDQTIVSDLSALDAALQAVDTTNLAECGLVLEENLGDVTTYSVGQVRLGALVASYCGTQRLTRDNHGDPSYGGSELMVVRGGFDTLLARELEDDVRLAVDQARKYDAAASRFFPGFFASRRNYDVAHGVDARGRQRSGVLEQSWRVGGASGAEIAALEAFSAEPALKCVRASCAEIYGGVEAPPDNASVTFHGHDDHVGLITKWMLVEPYDGPQ